MSMRMMTKNQRDKKLSKNLRLYRVAARQAVTAVNGGHKKIALRVIEQLEVIRGEIDQLITDYDHASASASILYNIKRIQQKQKKNLSGFAAAIKLGDGKRANQIVRFMVDADKELCGLLGIEME